MNIDDLIAKEDIILLDTSAIHLPDILLKNLPNSHTLGHLNQKILDDAILLLDGTINILDNDKIRLTPEVIDELAMLERKISYSYESFNYYNHVISGNGSMLKPSFKEFYNYISEMVKKARKSEIEHYEREFNQLSTITSLITSLGQLKKPSYNDTDEKLVTYSLYESLFNKKKSAIVTRDGDIRNILLNTSKIFASEFMIPENRDIAALQKNYPISLYFAQDGCLEFMFSTNQIPQISIHHFNNLPIGRSLQHMYNIKSLLKQASTGLSNPNQAYTN